MILNHVRGAREGEAREQVRMQLAVQTRAAELRRLVIRALAHLHFDAFAMTQAIAMLDADAHALRAASAMRRVHAAEDAEIDPRLEIAAAISEPGWRPETIVAVAAELRAAAPVATTPKGAEAFYALRAWSEAS